MSSAALPPLPSVRAKELERASADTSQAHDNSASDQQVDETAKAPSGSKDYEQNASASTNIQHDAQSSAPAPQSDIQRSEQLEMQHQKEKKVFGGLAPLESSVACNAIHGYISTTAAFLNSFIADVSTSHEAIDDKLTVLEKQMSMLESRIASIPDLFPDKESDHEEENENNTFSTKVASDNNGEEYKSECD